MGCICSSSIAFLLLLLCYSLTLRVLFLSSLCSEVFAISPSIITCKLFIINILYIYTFNYLYLKLSSFSVFTAASNSSLSPVWFAFKLLTSSLSYSIADEMSVTLSLILFPFSLFCSPSCLPFLSYMGRYLFFFGVSSFLLFSFLILLICYHTVLYIFICLSKYI